MARALGGSGVTYTSLAGEDGDVPGFACSASAAAAAGIRSCQPCHALHDTDESCHALHDTDESCHALHDTDE